MYRVTHLHGKELHICAGDKTASCCKLARRVDTGRHSTGGTVPYITDVHSGPLIRVSRTLSHLSLALVPATIPVVAALVVTEVVLGTGSRFLVFPAPTPLGTQYSTLDNEGNSGGALSVCYYCMKSPYL